MKIKMLDNAVLYIFPKEAKEFLELGKTLQGQLNSNLHNTISLLFIDLNLGGLFFCKSTVFLFTYIDPKLFQF